METEYCSAVDTLIRAPVHGAVADARSSVQVVRISRCHPILVRPCIQAGRIGAQAVVAKHAVGAVIRAGIHKPGVVCDVMRPTREI